MKSWHWVIGVFMLGCALFLSACGCSVKNPDILNSCGYVPVTNATIVKLQNQVRILQVEVESLKKQVQVLKNQVKGVNEAAAKAEDAAIKAKEAAIKAEVAAKRCERAFERNLVK